VAVYVQFLETINQAFNVLSSLQVTCAIPGKAPVNKLAVPIICLATLKTNMSRKVVIRVSDSHTTHGAV